MKRLFVKALIFLPVSILIFSSLTVQSHGSVPPDNVLIYLPADTTDLTLPVKLEPFNLEIVPPSSGIQFYRDGILFLSHSKTEDRMITDHVSFGTTETYFASLKDTVIGEHHIFSSSETFAVPSESMTFNSDYSVLFYAKRPKGEDPEKIFKAEYHSGRNGTGEWTSEKEPELFCSDNSTYTHPALSPSGDFLVFSSDRRGSSGGLDLYVTRRVGESWSSPENLGKSVNTSGNELFPFIDKNNNLFFSSDGLKGAGGYDVYFSRFNGKYWDKPVNLSKNINTADDELALKINQQEGITGFLSVREKSEARTFKLRRITFRDPYSQNKYSDLADALKFVAGIDVSPFKDKGQDSSVFPQAEAPGSKPSDLLAKLQKKNEGQATVKTDEPGKEPLKQPDQKSVEFPKQTDSKAEVAAQPLPADDEVVFRVQLLSYSNSKGNPDITTGGKTYKSFEYFLNGLYRSCVGEFRSVNAARELQTTLRQEGYPDAFVVAFKNNQRLLDPSVLKPVQSTKAPAEETASKPEQMSQPSGSKSEISKAEPVEKSLSGTDVVIYRVQLLSYSKSKESYDIVAGGNTYKSFEYFLNGSYRCCIGEFSTLAPARDLQRAVRQEGYPDAFVVVFKNNQRSMDPALLK